MTTTTAAAAVDVPGWCVGLECRYCARQTVVTVHIDTGICDWCARYITDAVHTIGRSHS